MHIDRAGQGITCMAMDGAGGYPPRLAVAVRSGKKSSRLMVYEVVAGADVALPVGLSAMCTAQGEVPEPLLIKVGPSHTLHRNAPVQTGTYAPNAHIHGHIWTRTSSLSLPLLNSSLSPSLPAFSCSVCLWHKGSHGLLPSVTSEPVAPLLRRSSPHQSVNGYTHLILWHSPPYRHTTDFHSLWWQCQYVLLQGF
jgi:hypothetical protein